MKQHCIGYLLITGDIMSPGEILFQVQLTSVSNIVKPHFLVLAYFQDHLSWLVSCVNFPQPPDVWIGDALINPSALFIVREYEQRRQCPIKVFHRQ